MDKSTHNVHVARLNFEQIQLLCRQSKFADILYMLDVQKM